MAKIRRDDTVMVIAGKDKGKVGRVLKVQKSGTKVLVEKLNMAKRHTKPTQSSPQGGIIDKEMPMDISNVMLLTKDQRPVRVGFKVESDGDVQQKIRIAHRSGEALD